MSSRETRGPSSGRFSGTVYRGTNRKDTVGRFWTESLDLAIAFATSETAIAAAHEDERNLERVVHVGEMDGEFTNWLDHEPYYIFANQHEGSRYRCKPFWEDYQWWPAYHTRPGDVEITETLTVEQARERRRS